jgi:hypothetical protein
MSLSKGETLRLRLIWAVGCILKVGLYLKLIKCYVKIFLKKCAVTIMTAICDSTVEFLPGT